MSLETAYRGTILEPNRESEQGFRQLDDMVVVVSRDGRVRHLSRAADVSVGPAFAYQQLGLEVRRGGKLFFNDRPLPETQEVIMPPLVNAHDHTFQPPGISGELLVPNGPGGFKGWLPDTLRRGELPAAMSSDAATEMAYARLMDLARNGTGYAMEYTTTSVSAAKTVLRVAEEIGLRVKVGYVCMDQGIDEMVGNLVVKRGGLQRNPTEAIRDTAALLDEFGSERVFVCDRFPLAVSSKTRRPLCAIQAEEGTEYETHVNETVGVQELTKALYDGRSEIKVLFDDGVFGEGSRVGLAHAIHTPMRDMDLVGDAISAGKSRVFIRACADSNAALGSHFDAMGRYIRFPLEAWVQRGAVITLGTDQGAGKTANLFRVMLAERGRHPEGLKPSAVDLLRFGTVSGLASMGKDPESVRLVVGRSANFVVVKMAGDRGFYKPGYNRDDLEGTAMRTIEGGADSENVLASWVEGKKVK